MSTSLSGGDGNGGVGVAVPEGDGDVVDEASRESADANDGDGGGMIVSGVEGLDGSRTRSDGSKVRSICLTRPQAIL
jgi:hypothetical protein